VLVGFEPGASWAIYEIGRRAGVSEANMTRIARDLEAFGWLHLERVRGGRVGHRWTVLIPLDRPADRVASAAKSRALRRRHREQPLQLATPNEGTATENAEPTPATCNPQPPPLAEQPLQLAETTPSTCNPRNEGTGEQLKGRTKSRAEGSATADPRWLYVVRRIEEHPISNECAYYRETRRLLADFIVGKHGLGVEAQTVDVILDLCLEHLRASAPGTKAEVALAEAMGETVDDLFRLRREYHAGKKAS